MISVMSPMVKVATLHLAQTALSVKMPPVDAADAGWFSQMLRNALIGDFTPAAVRTSSANITRLDVHACIIPFLLNYITTSS